MAESPLLLLALLFAIAVIIALATRSIGSNRRISFLRETGLMLVAFFIYHMARSVTEGEVSEALQHAYLITDLEKSLGLFVEPTWQAAIVGERWLVDLANWTYLWAFWPFIGTVAIWLYHSRPSTYRLFRNAFLISGAIGLIFFVLFPTAPPRLADLGFVDTVVEHSNFYHLLQPPQLTNQYAAFPSLHFGWVLLIGIVLIAESPRLGVKALGAVVPIAMGISIVLTANHYILDAVGGGMVALIGLGFAVLLSRRRERSAGRTPVPRQPIANV
ncbi:MAG: phosphatase PAP2 family protein [Dehalococcoidia bacterium]|nr:phosphatase PAP2 family protein [Dehalococcoidia bacterium]